MGEKGGREIIVIASNWRFHCAVKKRKKGGGVTILHATGRNAVLRNACLCICLGFS